MALTPAEFLLAITVNQKGFVETKKEMLDVEKQARNLEKAFTNVEDKIAKVGTGSAQSAKRSVDAIAKSIERLTKQTEDLAKAGSKQPDAGKQQEDFAKRLVNIKKEHARLEQEILDSKKKQNAEDGSGGGGGGRRGGRRGGMDDFYGASPLGAPGSSMEQLERNARRTRMLTFQLTSAFQDFVIVLQNGGSLDRAMLGTANNFGLLASTAAPLYAILGTVAVALAPTLVKALIDAEGHTMTYMEKVKNLTDALLKQKIANLDLAESYRQTDRILRETQMGIGTKQEVKAKADLEKAIGEVAAERFGGNADMVKDVQKYFVDQELKRVEAEKTSRDRIASSANTVSSQFGLDFLAKVKGAAEGSRAVLPFQQSFEFFGLQGTMSKLLEVAGRGGGKTDILDTVTGNLGRFNDEVVRQLGITGGGIDTMGVGPGRTLMGRQYTVVPGAEKNFERIMGEAIEAASKDPKKLEMLGKVDKGAEEAAKSLAELRKKSEEEMKVEERKITNEALEKAQKIATGKDIFGLQEFVGEKAFADMVSAAQRRVTLGEDIKEGDLKRKQQQEEIREIQYERLKGLEALLVQIREPGGGPGEEPLRKLIDLMRDALEVQDKQTQISEKSLTRDREMVEIKKYQGDIAKAASEILGEPRPERTGAEIAKAQEDIITSSRDLDGTNKLLIKAQEETTRALKDLRETLEKFGIGGTENTGPRRGLMRGGNQ